MHLVGFCATLWSMKFNFGLCVSVSTETCLVCSGSEQPVGCREEEETEAKRNAGVKARPA